MLTKHDAIFCLSIFLVILISFSLIGIFSVGHQPADDGVLFSLYDQLQEQSFINVIFKHLQTGETMRFRPLYYPYLIFKVHLFGLNIFYNLLFTALIGCISIMFFYLGIRKLNCSVLESFLFICLIFLGNQIVIIQRNDPNETLGVLFLSITFFFLSVKSKYISSIFFSIFLIFSSLCKESFTLIIPSLILLKIIIEKRQLNYSLKEAIKNNLILIIPSIIFFVNSIFIINSYLNSSGMYYSANNSYVFIKNFITLPLRSKQFFYYILITVAVFITIFIKEESNIFKFILKYKFIFIFLILSILPNMFIYANSRLTERYLLPVLFSIAFVIVILLNNLKNKNIWVYKFLIISISLCILPLFYKTIDISINHVSYSKKINELYKTIESLNRENRNILVVIKPDISWQNSVLTDNYIKHYIQKTPSFLFIESNPYEITEYGVIFQESLIIRYKEQMYSPDLSYDIILFLDTKYTDFISYTNTDENEYTLYNEKLIYPLYVKN